MKIAINEIILYSKKEHAKIVFKKCLRAGRLKLALKIAHHYNLKKVEENYDSVIAAGLAIIGCKKKSD